MLYVSFEYKVRPRTFGCIAMGSDLLFIVRSRLLVYSGGSSMNRVQVDLFCFVQAMYVCLGCTCVCGYDGDVIFVDHDLNRCTGWW